jgi:hypothetical protein
MGENSVKDLMFLRCVVGAIAGLCFHIGVSETNVDKLLIGLLLMILGIFFF